MLAEETRNMLSRGRKRIVHGRRYQKLDDRFDRPAARSRVEVCAFHISERRSDDDPRFEMRYVVTRRAELRERVERDIHPERTGDAPVTLDAAAEIRIECVRFDHLQVELPGVDVGDDAARRDFAAVTEGDAGGAPAARQD